MARPAFDFLLNSFLFNSGKIENNFHNVPESELIKELKNYRKHILVSLDSINEDLAQSKENLGVYFDTSSLYSIPPYDLLKRTTLYYDRCIIEDPIFKITSPTSENSKEFAKFLGLSPHSEIDRKELAKAAMFMKSCSPFVSGDFLNFAPISLQHESSPEIPLTYSENLYADRVPSELLGWFHMNAKVNSIERVDGVGLVSRPNTKLKPCRSIIVEFSGHSQPMIFHLSKIQAEPTEDPNRFKFIHTLPDTPPSKEQFEIWVTQSINQTAGAIFEHVASDMYIASKTGCMFFTNSHFVSNLLSLHLNETGNIQSDIANLAFQLDIPFLDNVSAEDLMYIRKNDGEAFDNFRINLQRHLRSVRHESDLQVVAKKLEDIQHELIDVQLKEIDLKIKHIKKHLYGSVAVGLASLATIIPSSGASVASLFLAGANVYKHGVTYINEIKGHPAYFLYRIKKEAKK